MVDINDININSLNNYLSGWLQENMGECINIKETPQVSIKFDNIQSKRCYTEISKKDKESTESKNMGQVLNKTASLKTE